jgi:hypothetical protein
MHNSLRQLNWIRQSTHVPSLVCWKNSEINSKKLRDTPRIKAAKNLLPENQQKNKKNGMPPIKPRIHQIHQSQPTFLTGARQGKCSVAQASPAPSSNLGV